jgi:hypothetical protein
MVHRPVLSGAIQRSKANWMTRSHSGIERMVSWISYWWRSTRNCFLGSYRQQVCINCKRCVATANFDLDSYKPMSTPHNQGDKDWDETDILISTDLQARQAQLRTIIECGL